MKTVLRKAIIVAAMVAQAACSDSPAAPDELRLEDMAGTWKATELRITNLETSETEEWLSSGIVFEFRMTLATSGAITFISIPEEHGDAFVSTGTLELEGQDVRIALDSGTLVGSVSLDRGVLTIDIPDEDGLRMIMVFRRA